MLFKFGLSAPAPACSAWTYVDLHRRISGPAAAIPRPREPQRQPAGDPGADTPARRLTLPLPARPPCAGLQGWLGGPGRRHVPCGGGLLGRCAGKVLSRGSCPGAVAVPCERGGAECGAAAGPPASSPAPPPVCARADGGSRRSSSSGEGGV